VVRADSVSYWRYDPDVESEPIAEAAEALAATFASGAELAAAWDGIWRAAIKAATSHEGSRPVRSGELALTLNEFLKTRVLEATVHGLDLAAALGRPAWATPHGLGVTTAILEALLGIPPPSSLGWDAVTFVEKGTGRQPLSPQEGVVLGELRSLFPLLR
jgi:Mycothiol maleylpyruvate isomerase N-terminal domain